MVWPPIDQRGALGAARAAWVLGAARICSETQDGVLGVVVMAVALVCVFVVVVAVVDVVISAVLISIIFSISPAIVS